MTLRLDPVRVCGPWRIGVLSDCAVSAFALDGAVACTGWKTPAAVVLSDGAAVRAVDLAGRALDLAVLEAGCPGLIAAMTAPASD